MREKILNNEIPIIYHGVGYIGTSGSIALAENGIRVLGYDINQNIVNKINKGESPLINLEFYVQSRFKELVDEGLIRATTNKKLIPKHAIHLIAVPSEKDSKPWWEPVDECLGFISTLEPILIVLESTLSVAMLETIQKKYKDLPICYATRRDWFVSPDQTLKTLDRIYGADKKEVADLTHEFLSIVSPKLHRASTSKIAVLVKSTENSLLHIPCIYLQQLSKAYPDVDIGELAMLCGTHPRINSYFLNSKISGYCIHISSEYTYEGASNKNELSILEDVIKTNKQVPYNYFNPLKDYLKGKKILVLGISYSPEHKMNKNTAVDEIVEVFKDSQISIHDPYFTEKEIIDTYNKPYEACWKHNLDKYDAIFVICPHKEYLRGYPQGINKGTYIFDNLPNGWELYRKKFGENGIYYYKPGDALNKLVPKV